jgi:hypothetical protein
LELNLFGLTAPSEAFKPDLDRLLALKDRNLQRIAAWVEESPDVNPETWQEMSKLSEMIGLPPQELNKILILTRFLLTNWKARNLTLDDILSDLVLLGYNEDQLAKGKRFLEQVGTAKEKVHRLVLKRAEERTILPTIDDINIVWDARPVFEDRAYSVQPIGDSYQNLIGTVYVMLLEISASRADGSEATETYQFTEAEFERLTEALSRARKQLEIFRRAVS